MSTIELVANSGQLSAFEFGHTQTTPAFGCSDQSGIHQLEHGALAESVWDDLGASPLLAERRRGRSLLAVAHGGERDHGAAVGGGRRRTDRSPRTRTDRGWQTQTALRYRASTVRAHTSRPPAPPVPR